MKLAILAALFLALTGCTTTTTTRPDGTRTVVNAQDPAVARAIAEGVAKAAAQAAIEAIERQAQLQGDGQP